MARYLLLVAALFTLSSAVFGFLNKGKIDALRTSVTESTQNLADNQAELDKLRSEDAARRAELEQGTAAAAAAQAELATAQTKLSKSEADLAALSAETDRMRAEITKLTSEQAAAPDPTLTPAPAADPAAEQKLKDAEARLAEMQQLNQTLSAKVGELEGTAKELRADKERRDRQVMARGLEGQVLAVNPGWNFVVISIGDRQGVTANAEMIVSRGGEMVGRVRITSVEPTTAIADIIPGSVPAGTTVRPGDRVIYRGS